MTASDLVVALGQDTLNDLLASLGSRPGLLAGSLHVPVGDRDIPLNWSLDKPPVLSLHEPAEAERRAAIGPRGVPPGRAAGAFTVLLPELTTGGPGRLSSPRWAPRWTWRTCPTMATGLSTGTSWCPRR